MGKIISVLAFVLSVSAVALYSYDYYVTDLRLSCLEAKYKVADSLALSVVIIKEYRDEALKDYEKSIENKNQICDKYRNFSNWK